MKALGAIATVIVLLALGISYLVLPGSEELGTMLLRDQKYEASRAQFEKQLEEGDISPATVTALLKIYVQYGDVDRAIALIRRFESMVGASPELLAQMVDLYRADRKLGLYIRALRRLIELEPTLLRLEDLADALHLANDPQGRIAALQRLRAEGWASEERLLQLGELLIAETEYPEAVAVLEELFATNPDLPDTSNHLALFELLMILGRPGDAIAWAEKWWSDRSPIETLITFAQSATAYGEPELALKLLRMRPDAETVSEAWRDSLAYALRQAGRDEEAWQVLSDWWSRGLLPPVSAPDLIDLAVNRQELDLALDVVDHHGPALLGFPPVFNLLTGLHRAGWSEETDRVLGMIEPGALDAYPLLAAEIMLARGDVAAAGRYADIALHAGTLDIAERIALASVLISLDRAEAAFDLLHEVMTAPDIPPEGIILLAELYQRLDMAEEGFWDVIAILARHNNPRLRAIWAHLALLTERRDIVLEWLAIEPEVSRTAATDLYFLAEQMEAWDIALAAARRIAADNPDAESLQRLAYALFRSGQLSEALEVIAPIAAELQDAETLYADVLTGLGRTADLVALWRKQLDRGDLTAERREILVYSLLEAGAHREAWPELKALALEKGGGWWFTLSRSAVELDRIQELRKLAAARISEIDPKSEEASAILYSLADANPTAALPVFRSLANYAPDHWTEAYLAALRSLGHTDELIRWAEDRLRLERQPDEVGKLAQFVAALAPPDMAAGIIKPHAEASREMAELYGELLRRSDQAESALDFELRVAGLGTFGTDFAQATAYRALEMGEKKAADTLLRQIAADAAPDSPIMQQLFYLWGPRPRPDVLDWIEARAETATGAERDAWIQKLLQMRAGDRVSRLIGGTKGAKGDNQMAMLVEIANQKRDPAALRRALSDAIARSGDPARLKAYAQLAEGTRDRALIQRAWEALLRAAPNSPEANRTLGLIAYDEGRLIDAERYLATYLSRGPGDVDSNYFYGDTLARTGREAQAGPYYRKAYDQLLARSGRDFQHEVTRANLLRRLGKTREAAKVMEALLDERPESNAVRADYADLLIEMGDLKRARAVLEAR